MGGFAWVTLATNDSYSLGALVLAHSLKQAGTVHQLAVLVTPGVTSAMREKLTSVFNLVQEVNILDSKDEANLRLLKRPELGVTFTKLHCWRLTQYEKCVFLDADTLVLQNADELFEREEFSAAPDVGWPDCFNSGVFVYRPSLDTYEKLIAFALEKGSFDGGDQGLLNLFFSDWAYKDISKHLPFIYNLCSTACYSYLPAYKQFGANAKIVHFIGATKPWLQYFNTETKTVQPSGEASHLQDVLQRWWNIFCSLIHPQLSPAMAGLAGAFAQLTLGVPRTQEQEAFDSLMRKQAWEVGNIDYLGRDSFENIWSKITQTLSAGAPEPAPPAPVVAPAESQSQSTALPQEEAKPDEPPVDISTAVDSLSLEPTESEPSVVTSLPAEEATPSVTETVPIETKSSPQESVQVIPKEAVIEPPQPATPQKETPLPVESVISSEKEVETVSQKEVEPVLEPAVVSPPVVEPPVIPQPIVEPSVVSQPVEVLQPAEQPPVVSGPTQKESEPTLPSSTLPESSPVIPQVVPKETEPLVTAQVVKEAEQTLAASQVAVDAPKESVPSSPLPEISTKESSKPVAKEPAPKAATPKEPQKGKPAEAPAAPVAEKPKQAPVEAATTSEPASTPTPPPRKTDKPKKVASKPKK